jgi:hypothetical protein
VRRRPAQIFFILAAVLAAVFSMAWWLVGLRTQQAAKLTLEQERVRVSALETQLTRQTHEASSVPVQTPGKVPRDADQPGLMQLLESTAKDNGVSISQISFSGKPSASPLQFSVECTATSEESLLKFIHGLEFGPRLLQLVSVSINRGSNGWFLTAQWNAPFGR